MIWKSLKFHTLKHHKYQLTPIPNSLKGEHKRRSQILEFFKIKSLVHSPCRMNKEMSVFFISFSSNLSINVFAFPQPRTGADLSRQKKGREMKFSFWEHMVLFRVCFTTGTCRDRVYLCSTLPLTHSARKTALRILIKTGKVHGWRWSFILSKWG